MAQYGLNNSTWLDATMGDDDYGMINITSASAGVDHVFMWAGGTDMRNRNANVYFRIRPFDDDLTGAYVITNAFPRDNRVRGDFNSDDILTPTDAAIAHEIAAGSRITRSPPPPQAG